MRELMAMLPGHGVAPQIFIGCLILLLSLLRAASGPPAPIAKPFLTRREAAMLRPLEQVLPMYRIHAQVAMGALLKAPAGLSRGASFADRNSFSQKIVDFVIHDPTTGKVIALVEVDDYSHDIARDRKRDAMTARAGYLTIRIPGSTKPTVQGVLAAVGRLREPIPADA